MSNGYDSEYLFIFSVLAIFLGILVIINKNPIVSILFLICLFVSISSYLILLGLHFIGLSYLLVYIGAVSILFLFILMLIDIRISELHVETNNSLPLAILIGVAFYSILYKAASISDELINDILKFKDTNTGINFASSNIWDNYLSEASHITSIGNVMYTNYFLWLVITSIILLLAMVGSIVITIKSE